jgi:hypothetical protein
MTPRAKRRFYLWDVGMPHGAGDELVNGLGPVLAVLKAYFALQNLCGI